MNKLYMFFDKLAGTVLTSVHVFKHDAAAIRFFGDVASDPKTMIAKHVDDYELLCVGEIDDQGVLMDVERPVVVISGAQWRAAQAVSSIQEVK